MCGRWRRCGCWSGSRGSGEQGTGGEQVPGRLFAGDEEVGAAGGQLLGRAVLFVQIGGPPAKLGRGITRVRRYGPQGAGRDLRGTRVGVEPVREAVCLAA
ncbi:hypothetical protein ScoT_29700 [Streptomyces albidoflavus]|uniref:Uncharacterized protein n=1 Tax=Streptomyces albidoflavus TaxID=1886 RepID=A0AA37BXS9_9ACTN|nr:hypothetical protein ScoT_29700 [Streptomyces albidoflavus]